LSVSTLGYFRKCPCLTSSPLFQAYFFPLYLLLAGEDLSKLLAIDWTRISQLEDFQLALNSVIDFKTKYPLIC